ncbi:FAD binding domain-containing protein [Thioclava electrotropha]|uniref:Xanthine dehydrogenase family protein subunit M n=1 Tax=Thioclava electrotropha TaxID=1549850 RepID=A0ABX6YR27_9RHOB|nr:xanthine dehydrogenase family protein subunit M [Thioclava electrotropha]QPZ89987.1 xanthine dehydrogenase family protein subunit M [Thioclava electrotropha]
MKLPSFEFLRARSLAEAWALHSDAGGDAVYLSGGHSVVPSMALRLQAPSRLIDISQIAELHGVELQGETLRIGAMTRHAEVLANPLIARHAPLLSRAAPHVAHPAIRNRGTIGGNLALADPASEFPAAVLAMRAELEVMGPEGRRMIAADDFFLDLYETALIPGEVLTAIHVPLPPEGRVFGFDEIARRRGDYAMVGVAAQADMSDGVVSDASVTLFSVGVTPMRAAAAQDALEGAPLSTDSIARAQAALATDLDPPDDPGFPAERRLQLARVLLGRVLTRMEAVQ